ncbi:MAG TPA: LamG-like jellyroll fold domain-containing protein [Planctomycetota bacterium]|nr:LamG-like jellyroll fold domain-containing protein [Planctomycetota bacterium]
MRTITLVALALVAGGCSLETTGAPGNTPPTLTLLAPAAAALVAPGALLRIDYVDADAEDTTLTVVYADGDGDPGTTADQIAITLGRTGGSGVVQTVFWDTTGVVSGTYTIVGSTLDGQNPPVVATATGLVTVNAPPTVSFTGPVSDVEATVGSIVAIGYADDDPDDDATTGLFADTDGDPATTGDRYAIGAARPEQDGAPQSLDWDTSGVPAGTYRILAVTSDGRHLPVAATATGIVTLVDPGMAIELLGDGGNVTFANPLAGDRTTFTFEMWIKLWHPPVVGAPQPTRNLIYVESYVGGGPLDGAQRNFTFVSLDDGGVADDQPGAILQVSWPNDGLAYPYTDPVPQGEWMHLAFVRTGSTLRIFVNGALAAEGGALTYTGPEPTEFHLGLFVNPVSGNEWGRFVVDEVRVSSVARYDADFVPAVRFEPDGDTLSLWHFDEAAGTATADASGNESDAVLAAGATRVVAER